MEPLGTPWLLLAPPDSLPPSLDPPPSFWLLLPPRLALSWPLLAPPGPPGT
jgi:hypothetical protein